MVPKTSIYRTGMAFHAPACDSAVRIYFLEGIAELLLDFWREPVREQAAPLETVKEVDEQLEDVEETMGHGWGENGLKLG